MAEETPNVAKQGQIRLTEYEIAWLREHPEVRIGVMDGWPPFNFVDKDGVPQGIGADYIEALNKRLYGALKIVPGAWEDIYDDVKDKRLDALMDITPKPSREEFFNFTTPYLDVPHVIVARRDEPFLRNEDDLKGKTLALERGFGNVKYFNKNYPQVKIKEYRDTGLALGAVIRDEADAYAGNRTVALYLIEQEVMANLKVHGRLKKPGSILAIGIRKDWPLLRDILQKALDDISREEKRIIIGRWVTPELEKPEVPVIALTPEEKAWLSKHEQIRLGVDPEFAPFEFIDNDGCYHGMCAEYVSILNQRLGLNMKVVPDLTWKEAVEKAEQKEVDVLPCVGMTEERKRFLNYSKPHLSFTRVIITRNDAPFIVNIRGLSASKVAVQVNSSHHGYIMDETDIKPLLYDTVQEALIAVSKGEAEAFVGNMAASAYWITKSSITNLKIAALVSTETKRLYFAVRDDWPELVRILNKGLDSISPEEENAIRQKWVSIPFEQRVHYTLLLKAVGLVFVVVLLLMLWIINIRRQKEAIRKSEQKFRTIVEGFKKGFFFYSHDTNGNFTYVSPSIKDVLGYEQEDYLINYLETFTDNPVNEAAKSHTEQSMRGFIQPSYEIEVKHKDGGVRQLLTSEMPVINEKKQVITVDGIAYDITERKKVKEQLQQANLRLQELDRLKSMFIASMSHELRTPLNSIIGFSSIILNGWIGPLNDEQKENLSTVLRSGKHLLALINDVIDVSKIEAGKIDSYPEDFDLYDVVSEALAMFTKELKDKKLELKVESIHQKMHMDRRRLLQCVVNLISNAVKFTEDGTIAVQARLEEKPEELPAMPWVEISVSDTGIGIKEEDIPKLFLAFHRIDTPLRTKVKGTGLGMYLTKKILAEILKGEITVESKYGKGSTFSIRIPVTPDVITKEGA